MPLPQARSGGNPTRLARLAEAHGVALSHEPEPGRHVQVPEGTVVEVLAALGVDASTPRAVRAALERHEWDGRQLLPPTVVLRSGARPVSAPARTSCLSQLPDGTVLRVVTDSGTTLDWGPGTRLPLGVHTLFGHAPDERAAHSTLIVVPEAFPAPRTRASGEGGMGLRVRLRSLLSARSRGRGDLADLGELADWAGRCLGADFLQLDPSHSAVPVPDETAPVSDETAPVPGGRAGEGPAGHAALSSCLPSSRRFPDPVHLRVEDVLEFGCLGEEQRRRAEVLLGRAAALREGVSGGHAPLGRGAVWELKREALELVRSVPLGPGRRAAYEDFVAERGQALVDHATWCALAEAYGSDWRSWPAGLDDPRSAHTARVRAQRQDRVDFHAWAAWLTDCQLAAAQHTARQAGMAVGLVLDPAAGAHPGGSDAWSHQHSLAQGVTLGAPPRGRDARGQDWGLPPWRPDALARAGYGPYREVLAGLFRHAGALRRGRALGRSRLWWIPEGRPPAEGTYVRYDAEALHGVLALEAHRAGAAVLGEDPAGAGPGARESAAPGEPAGLGEPAGRRMRGASVSWPECPDPPLPVVDVQGRPVPWEEVAASPRGRELLAQWGALPG
ncbi:4-alpha-glucanotransferase [Streptomyces diacarni]|uniref:4-alpha-glucanotransferase n=1 Tax=Streptomyces diacarni TaxID=2800381 RepID=A0A367F914_9ACTN|nr:4-alpha-glucanotransferase [Streptomyces diacarni]